MIFNINHPKDFQAICIYLKKKYFINQTGSLIFFLNGNFGVGKTTFVKYLAKSLNIKETITSASFNFYNIYSLLNNNLFIHADFYKLESSNQHLVSEIFEYFTTNNNIIVIEWADKFKNYSDFILKNAIKITISFKDNDPLKTRICQINDNH
ncbi:tRNA (adenosine(37)-N6)-threonylcarbamoyltransferase complex ATPase subunit type 1 TsaE [Mycoplasma sp. SG1]|uniref:tRNA (adenosine(37)-N6)-threonylcarbamoyltransferase complex ATPase subunit type 1 TsaE n=1 Tax=Mycoplasma sp. SG1 TaxID=2810348 RepID=UPI0020245EF1|nr:tRNA (adenosine(37)-N6)-threonylcarbamoyltransferase complex ATPase subunit type 1 TsaE [Mycoplasma sp. SG1]URM52947.1 tRNA (adenosine(37)-N6)-threonylcarbamoyltransferase complex ATPase subunit type 1 TsaE [Mycoplasma sp. SG1]